MSDLNTVRGLDTPATRLPAGSGRADSELRQLSVAGKPFYLLRQRGRFADLAYDHGRLLAREIEQGVFPEILSAIARGTDLGDRLKSGVAEALFRGLSNRVVENVSGEVMASSPDPRPAANTAPCKAAVPELYATACAAPTCWANACSKD